MSAFADLRLPKTMRDEIIDHARETWPRECCGLIGGIDGTAHELRRITNTDPGNTFYLMDDRELLKAYRDFDDRGWEFLVIYHSHPVSVAYPSKTDVELAAWPDANYVICSLENPMNPIVRAFRIVDQQIHEVDVLDPDPPNVP